MAASFTEIIDQVVSLFQASFEHTTVLRREERLAAAILEMRGDYGPYRVYLQEIWRADGSRKYAYYVLSPTRIVAGFDNAADPRALRLKYSKDAALHRFEPVPHRHTEGKEVVEISEEMDCAAFIAWLRTNLPSVRESSPIWSTTPSTEWSDSETFACEVIANNRDLFEELARLI